MRQPPPKGFRLGSWRSRGYLPHFDPRGSTQQVTFRLADSLPAERLAQWQDELSRLPEGDRRITREKWIADWLDQGFGECHLRDERVAAMVEKTLLHFDGERYRLLAWCIMPNHVHTVAELLEDHTLEKMLHSWKSFSAKEANRLLGRSGRFWQSEYHDRFIRNEAHLKRSLEYVERNPVVAGLVDTPEAWRWSSARHRVVQP